MTINFNEIAQRVATWNSIAGMDTEDNKALEEQIELYVHLCYEEAEEGTDAYSWEDICKAEATVNYTEVLDSAVDQFVVLSRLIHLLEKRGFDVNKAFEKVLENNDSKFIDNTYEKPSGDLPEVILENFYYYKQKFIEAQYRYNPEHDKFVLLNRQTGKILKPKGFVAVDLGDCVPEDLK
jgi:hypothetical protein